MRRCPTPAEKKLWNLYLKSFRVRVLRQRPIDYFIVDFFCAALRLVIEVDGGVHFTEQGQAHDEARSDILKGCGLRVLRFTNEEVMEKFEWVQPFQIQKFQSLNPLVSHSMIPLANSSLRFEPTGIKIPA